MNFSSIWKTRRTVGIAGFLLGVVIWFAPSIFRSKYRDAARISEITLERKGCYGGCPIYKVVFSRDNTATFTGIRYVDRIGAYKSGIDFTRIAQGVNSQGFFDLRDEYAVGTFDAGVVVTTAVRQGIRKTVTTYDSAAPPLELWGINAAIDGVVWKATWAKVQ